MTRVFTVRAEDHYGRFRVLVIRRTEREAAAALDRAREALQPVLDGVDAALSDLIRARVAIEGSGVSHVTFAIEDPDDMERVYALAGTVDARKELDDLIERVRALLGYDR